MSNKKIRNSVKLILLNEENELLLMSTDDKEIHNKGEKYRGKFWQMIGGGIEVGETIKQCAYRELFEETGLTKEQVIIGKAVWYGEVDLMMHGDLTTIKQTFVIARTKDSYVNLENLTEEEKESCLELKWFSIEDIKGCQDIIYPVLLTEEQFLPSIIKGNITKKVKNIDLSAKAK